MWCGIKYSPCHTCIRSNLFSIIKSETEDTIPELDDYPEVTPVGIAGIEYTLDPVLSLHAIKHQKAIILIDSGSSHNFMDKITTKRIGWQTHQITGIGVKVANGHQLWARDICYDVPWEAQGLAQCTTFMLLPLSGCDVVLGVEWLVTLGPILWDFSKLTMEFTMAQVQYCMKGLQAGSIQLVTQKHAAKFSVTTLGTCAMLLHNSYEPSLCQVDITALPVDLQNLLTSYEFIFETPTTLPPSREHDHRIPLIDEQQTVKLKPYRYPAFQKDEIERLISEMLQTGVIRNSTSAFASPVELVKKKDGSWRLCIDYRQLNKLTMKDRFPIPLVEELLDELSQACCFSNLDLRSGYHQIRMHEDDHLQQVFDVLAHNQLYLKHSKCEFGAATVVYLGHVISKGVVAMDVNKVQAVSDWPVQKSIMELRGFLGLTRKPEILLASFSVVSSELLDQIKHAWLQDPHTVHLMHRAQASSDSKYTWQAGLLRRNGKLVIANDAALRQALITHFHSSSLGVHSGVNATMQRISSAVYWKGLKKQSKGKDTIMVVVDRLSKYAHFIPMSHPFSALTVAQDFWDYIYKLHGTPKSITDGQSEVVNHCLETYLRCMSGGRPQDWAFWLPLVEFGMKNQADKHRSDRSFAIGNLVYVKLQTYCQKSMVNRCCLKLSARFFGPYKVVQKIGVVAYKLELPPGAKIHPVFHVSQLKKHVGLATTQSQLPALDDAGLIAMEPITILDRRINKRRGRMITEVLVQWSNCFPEDATWECLYEGEGAMPIFPSTTLGGATKESDLGPTSLIQVAEPISIEGNLVAHWNSQEISYRNGIFSDECNCISWNLDQETSDPCTSGCSMSDLDLEILGVENACAAPGEDSRCSCAQDYLYQVCSVSDVIEPYILSRVVRQLGYVQVIPPPILIPTKYVAHSHPRLLSDGEPSAAMPLRSNSGYWVNHVLHRWRDTISDLGSTDAQLAEQHQMTLE
ncbi:reverse transcriptase [Corchorus capsularis]|uniref:Reverse transcriptase n=1 Tax=Corchorus capsularis TaxID=210143 RepID=A0A1R3JI34_COCAP|nr:reverse transcriptase [Corchorus capsularis]